MTSRAADVSLLVLTALSLMPKPDSVVILGRRRHVQDSDGTGSECVIHVPQDDSGTSTESVMEELAHVPEDYTENLPHSVSRLHPAAHQNFILFLQLTA